MFVNQQSRTELADADGGIDWRRRLMERLADVQVALWVAEPEPVEPVTRDAADSDDLQPPLPFSASSEAVFVGLNHLSPEPRRNDASQNFDAWDELDEKRHLLGLAQTISSQSDNVRRSGTVLGLLGATTLGLLSLAAVSLQSETTHADAGSVAEIATAAPADKIVTEKAEEALSLATGVARYAATQSIVPDSINTKPIRVAAADKTDALVAEAAEAPPPEVRPVTFKPAIAMPVLVPVITVDVQANRNAALPFVVNAGDVDLTGAIVFVTGLPKDVVPALGSSPAVGVWMFKLSDLPQQRLIVLSDTPQIIKLRLTVMKPQGEVVAHNQIQLDIRYGISAVVVRAPALPVPPAEQSVQPQPTEPLMPSMAKPKLVTAEQDSGKEPAQKSQRGALAAKSKPPSDDARRMALGADRSANTAANRGKPEGPPQPKSIWSPQDQPTWSPFKTR